MDNMSVKHALGEGEGSMWLLGDVKIDFQLFWRHTVPPYPSCLYQEHLPSDWTLSTGKELQRLKSMHVSH